MEKKRYLQPKTRIIDAYDLGGQMLSTSNDQKTLVRVDPIEETYYGGEGSNDDYLIKF